MTISKRYLFLVGLISLIAMNASDGSYIKEKYLMIPMVHLMMPIFYVVGLVVLFFINSYILHYFLSIRIGTAAWRYMVVSFLSGISVFILISLFIVASYVLMIRFGFKIDLGVEIWQNYVWSLIVVLVALVVQYYLYKRIFDPSVNKTNLKKALLCICFFNMMGSVGQGLVKKLIFLKI